MFRINYIWALLMVVALSSCEQGKYDREIEPPIEVVSGEADFTNYVALGNSSTAGLADGALFIASQDNSYPNLLAQKMALSGGGEFTQPYMDDNIGGLLLNGTEIEGPFGPRLFFDGAGLGTVPGPPTTDVTNIQPGPYNNMGVPGARSFHLLAPGYGNIANLQLGLANPYFVRMASNPNASVFDDALAANPTFFSLRIGANDVLGYATSGGDGSSEITDKNIFDGSMAALIGNLSASGAKGIVANIANVLQHPFFTTVPFAPLDPSNPDFAAQIPLLNGAYAQLNMAFAAIGFPDRSVVFSETEASPIVIFDESLVNISGPLKQALMFGGQDELTATLLSAQYGQSRQANEGDLVLLTSQSAIAELNTDYFQYLVGLGVPPEFAGQLSVNGLTYPLADNYVLVPSEQTEISEANIAFNQTIEQLAANAGLPVFDAYSLLNDISENGYSSNGFTVTGEFIFGGLFSLDGIHLSARGNAVLANEMLKLIDATYDSNFEEAGALYDIGDFPTIYSAALR